MDIFEFYKTIKLYVFSHESALKNKKRYQFYFICEIEYLWIF